MLDRILLRGATVKFGLLPSSKVLLQVRNVRYILVREKMLYGHEMWNLKFTVNYIYCNAGDVLKMVLFSIEFVFTSSGLLSEIDVTKLDRALSHLEISDVTNNCTNQYGI